MLEVIHKVQVLFQDVAVDLGEIDNIDYVDDVTNQLQVRIRMTKLEIRSEYSFPKVNKDGIVTPKFVMEFIDTVVGNLGYLLRVYCSSSLLFVPGPNKELGDVYKELMLLRNFVSFVSDRSVEPKTQHTDFFTHVLEVVSHVAMIAWLHLPRKGDGSKIMNDLLSDLLQKKIKPIDPSIRKIYVDVLLALRSTIQSE